MMTLTSEKPFGISSFWLHIIAMTAMLCDHLWATVCSSWWLTFFGKTAFPIFAFMLVEGFFCSHDHKKYALRLLLGAVISEIPFNLMMGGSIFYPAHQNVLWTLLLGLLGMMAAEKLKEKKIWGRILGVLCFLLLAGIALAAMLDFYQFGILTVMVFYYFRGRKWTNRLLQLAGLYMINVVLWGSMAMDITVFGQTFEVLQQGFALLAMIPIMLYNGEQGPHGKAIQALYYLFYPCHMLLLSLAALYLL